MIVIAVLQTMEAKAREAGKIPDHARFWDFEELKVFFTAGGSFTRIQALIDAGVACSYAIYTTDSDPYPKRRGQVRFDYDGSEMVRPTLVYETEQQIFLRELQCDLPKAYQESMSWVMTGQLPWDDQQHNGNMFLMRKMLTM